jgi:hypothetical protein
MITFINNKNFKTVCLKLNALYFLIIYKKVFNFIIKDYITFKINFKRLLLYDSVT